MDLDDAAPQDWQEERYTLQRLLVRTSLFATGQDGTIDALLENLRNALRHESCELDMLRGLQHDLDNALEQLDDKRARSERQLKASLAQILDALDQDGEASRKQYRALGKQIDKLELDGDAITAWLSELAALTAQARPETAREEPRGWRRFFSRHEDEPESVAQSRINAQPASTASERGECHETEQRLRIARRIGELLGHVLEQVSLEPNAYARALHLKQLLDQSYEWTELRDALNEIVDLVIAAVSRGRTEFEDFLKRPDERLAALKANCEAQVEAGADRRTATEVLDQALNSQLEDMGAAMAQAKPAWTSSRYR